MLLNDTKGRLTGYQFRNRLSAITGAFTINNNNNNNNSEVLLGANIHRPDAPLASQEIDHLTVTMTLVKRVWGGMV